MSKLIKRIESAIDGASAGGRAEAVLAALREPTHAMLVAASSSRSGSGLGIWQAMIDAALAEGDPIDDARADDWVVTARTIRAPDPGLNDDSTTDRREANG